MISHKKEFFMGSGLMAVFIVVLVVMFMPVFSGQNALEYLDALYNSISKGSAYYIPKVKKEASSLNGTTVSVDLQLGNDAQVDQTAALFVQGGAQVNPSGTILTVNGDLGKMLENSLIDADLMYHNKGSDISKKYGQPEKQVLFNWWRALSALDLALKKQKKFSAAKLVDLIQKKAVETAYNYYGIEGQKISDRIWVVIFSLLFYVVYTLWYGFAILYLFEGCGLKLGH